MYYRKYFAGAIESYSPYRVIKRISNNATAYDYYNQSDVICSAIKSTLEDVGIQCDYDETARIFNIEGTTIQIFSSNNSGQIIVDANGIPIGNIAYNTFSGVSYKFYVTLKGDKDGIFKISIGLFSSPASEAYGFVIGKGTDLRDGHDIRVVYAGSILTVTVGYILKDDAILPEYRNAVNFGFNLSNVNEINNNGKEITLVECVAQPGRFKLNNCYFGSNSLTTDYFYNIGGDIYYCTSSNILVKCVNEQSS